jgi:hypothetical protein
MGVIMPRLGMPQPASGGQGEWALLAAVLRSAPPRQARRAHMPAAQLRCPRAAAIIIPLHT